jgi:shikimate 5-dehydrogenase
MEQTVNVTPYTRAEKPTLYFIGVTTGKSSIMRVFPEWARFLGLGDCAIKGMDFVPHDRPERYREAVEFIKYDPRSLGALVTTHKIDLLKACRDQFDGLDEYATLMGETSCISKRDGRLLAHAKDPITSGLSLEAFLPARHWEQTGAEALVLGAGGSAIAITWYLLKREHGRNRPVRIVVANRSPGRLQEMREIHQRLGADVPVEYHHVPAPELSDELVRHLRPGSLVINATGLGKDAPGSPITDAAVFPQDGLVWEFNYRGDLVFLRQARAQEPSRHLRIEDGWIYFIHGWTRVIAEVFHVDIPVQGPRFDELSRMAALVRT